MKRKLIVSCMILLLLTGCWDKVEIEDRGFVVGVAVDTVEGEENKLMLTQQVVVPSQLQGKGGTGGTGASGGGAMAYINVEETGESVMGIVREVAGIASRSPYYGHVKGIIISTEYATKRGIADVLDYFMRNSEMRRGIIVYISEDKASNVLEISPANEKLPMMYIDSISKNAYKNAEIFPQTRVGEIHDHMVQNWSFGISMVRKKQNNFISLTDTAVINGKTDKMVGVLKREATVGVNFVRNEIRGGIISVNVDGEPVTFDIYRSGTKVTANANSPDNISFNIKVNVEGGLGETFLHRDFVEPGAREDIEEKIGAQIKEFIITAVTKCQEDFQTDIFGFGQMLHGNNYELWKEIKDDWEAGENYFSQADIHVDVTVLVRNPGAVNRTS